MTLTGNSKKTGFSLPIDQLLEEIVEKLRVSGALVVRAAPGAGKTTRIPPALFNAGFATEGDIVVLEPRRLATRMAARAVAVAFGEPVGKTVGYQVRFDEKVGPDTRIRFVTEGILTRRLISDPNLKGTAVVILDEFHERHLATDVALARLRQLQKTSRPDLKLVVMSATLDADPLADFLGNAPVVVSEGRQFPVEVEFLKRQTDVPVERLVAESLAVALDAEPTGHVLIFLPGAAEIRKCRAACQNLMAAREVLPLTLHGDLSGEEQDAVVRPSSKRKIIFSTNLAESSVTIDGVTVVIDAGTARVARFSPWNGLPTLAVERVSRASAIQRAGRAGRTAPGRCYRLYTEADFNLRPAFETAEIHRSDLSETLLELKAGTIGPPEWFEAPPEAALSAAETLLLKLGALDSSGNVTAIGRRMLRFPVFPRLGRLIVECADRGQGDAGAMAAALLSERDIRGGAFGGGKTVGDDFDDSDVLALIDAFRRAARFNVQPDRVRELGLDPGGVQRVERVRRQLGGLVGREKAPVEVEAMETAVLKGVLAAFPDRVARVRKPKTGRNFDVVLPGGGTARLAETSVVRREGPICAVDAEVRGESVVRLASHIEADWVLELFFDDIEEFDLHEWNGERVVRRRGWAFNGIVFEEKTLSELDPERAGDILGAEIGRRGWRNFTDADAVENFLNRISFLAKHFPEAGFPEIGDAVVIEAVKRLAFGASRVNELKNLLGKGALEAEIAAGLTAEQRRLLDRCAPEFLQLGNRRRARVTYERDQPPYLASRLQDFFGMTETPRIADGRAQLVLHLLAPNNRPIQVTTDLKGFWERVYRELRPQLSRRYPKHAFPENPAGKS